MCIRDSAISAPLAILISSILQPYIGNRSAPSIIIGYNIVLREGVHPLHMHAHPGAPPEGPQAIPGIKSIIAVGFGWAF